MASQVFQKLTTKQRNDLVWDSMKVEISQLLIIDGKSLQETRNIIEKRHCFSASERKWKMKLHEWKFKKNIPSADMRFMVNIAEKRRREENKETLLYYRGDIIEQRRLDNFKKKKLNLYDTVTDAATPSKITYHTPPAMKSDDIEPGITTTPTILVENRTIRDHVPASHECNSNTSVNGCKGPVNMTPDSQLRRDEPIQSFDPSGLEIPPVVLNTPTPTTNAERKFPSLRALREESRMRGDHIASLERSRYAFYLDGDLRTFPKYVKLSIEEEELRFLKEVIRSIRKITHVEEYPDLFPSDFPSRNRQSSELWDEFIELMDLVLVKWPSTPQDWHWSRLLELVLSCNAAFGLANWITISLVCRYADFLVMVDFPYLAEDILRMVIANLSDRCPTLQLHCKLSLAAIFYFTEKFQESVETLTPIISGWSKRTSPNSTSFLYPSLRLIPASGICWNRYLNLIQTQD